MFKKIAIIVGCAVLATLITLTVIASVSVSYFGADINKPNIIRVTNLSDNEFTASVGGTLDSEKIWDFFSEASQQNYLMSLFNKDLYEKPTITKTALTTFSSNDAFVITFSFAEEQTLRLNGQNYVDTTNSNLDEIKYKVLKFVLSTEDNYARLAIRVMDLTSTTKYIYTINQTCNLYDVYSYFLSIDGFESGTNI